MKTQKYKNIINCNNTNFFKKMQLNQIILALGAESAGNFSIYFSEKIYFSENFDDLLDEKKYKNFQKSVLNFLKKNKIKPTIILTDLHPLYKTTIWGKKLAKNFKAKHIKIQHHLAHIFSAVNEKEIQNSFIGIACDGTGYGLDGKIWGGEIFNVKCQMSNVKYIERIGHLENQIMIGGDLAVKEPARMLISILDKIFSLRETSRREKISNFSPLGKYPAKTQCSNFKNKKNFIYHYIKKYYTKNQFKLLYNQLQQNFNCQETSSTGRILDAVSILLGFCKNERNYKHEPIDLLEKNSTTPYKNLKLKISSYKLKAKNYQLLETTPLFKYLIKNLHCDKKRLAATAQLYIAQGLYKIILKSKILNLKSKFFFSGGIANNKIISNYLKLKSIYISKKIPCGDAGISMGQIMYYISAISLKN